MVTRSRPTTALALAVCLLGGCLLGGCTEERNEPGHVRCTEHEEERVAVLARLPILDARPVGAEATGGFSGCGEDDSGDPVASHAAHTYRSTLTESEIRAYYWDELKKDGWRNASTAIAPEVAPALAFLRGISCLVKDIEGTRVVVTVAFDPPPGSSASPAPAAFAVTATDQDPENLQSPC
ncbi:hypothetical protein [Actinoplanes flavus]|uniref:Lipoprotein n=1 Tax=Actinoplanes flavus TaxID=2820290 RepID=A0ABS3V0B4_9ACTN|nr:hypothetical protein [Actinoplanes flavus]MBO3744273.1 hypothetical protein [Actinoplanes flavus]